MENVNLMELFKQGVVKKGNQKINVVIDEPGKKQIDGQTYLIPLEYLYYNDENGRIGSALSEYVSENGEVTTGHNEEYNAAIQSMIIKGHEKTMEALKRDIGKKGQSLPGYVLNDGRVVDGNRRFTAKRMLEGDESVPENQYFEAVILSDLNIENSKDKAVIKELELKIQFGQLGKEDYDPIDKAIDAYQTVCVRMLMTAKNYAEYTGFKKTEVDNLIAEAKLISEFLEFVNADSQNFALAKSMKLDGPLRDLLVQYKRDIEESEDKDDILDTLFTEILRLRLQKDNNADFKGTFRPIVKKVIGTKRQDGFVDSLLDPANDISNALEKDGAGEQKPVQNIDDLARRINSSPEAKKALAKTQEVVTEFVDTVSNDNQRNEPQKLAKQALNKLNAIDDNVFEAFGKSDKENLLTLLVNIENQVSQLKTSLEED